MASVLIGAVLVGLSFAKSAAFGLGVPLIPVHHVRGHIAANYIAFPDLEPPFLTLAISGGNTLIVDVQDYTDMEILGSTRDDAAGECFDKAARVLGANDTVLFVKVIFPATTPFIITAIRLGISAALTTLIAAESTGAIAGLGMRIKTLSTTFDTPPMLLYIIIVGVIGMIAEKVLKFFERRLTSWQEKREI